MTSHQYRLACVLLATALAVAIGGCLGGLPADGAAGPDPGTESATGLSSVTPTTAAGPASSPAGGTTTASSARPSDRSTSAVPTTLAPLAYPDPPADVETASNEALRETARAYERAHRRNSLLDDHHLTYFSMGYREPASVTVLNRSAGNATVSISGTYSYGTPRVSADFVPFDALYVIDATHVRRVG